MNMWQTIRAGAYRGMSDDALADELTAQKALQDAIAAMSAAIAKVNFQSSVIKINSDAWADFIHDELPTERQWEELIHEARR